MANTDYFDEPQWLPEAKVKLKNIPYFVRTQARQRIEQLAEPGIESDTESDAESETEPAPMPANALRRGR